MGVFDNIRSAVNVVKSGVAEAQAAARAQEEAARNAPIEILNPTPQDEVDRLNAAGGPARGVLASVNYTMEEEGDMVWKMPVTLQVRARLADGQLGTQTKIRVWISSRLAKMLRRGHEIPVMFDRATGIVTEVDAKAMAAEFT